MRPAIGRQLARRATRLARVKRQPAPACRRPKPPHKAREAARCLRAATIPARSRGQGSSAAPAAWCGNDWEAGCPAAVADNHTSLFDFWTTTPALAASKQKGTTYEPSTAQPQPKMANGQWQVADWRGRKRFGRAARALVDRSIDSEG